MNPNRLGECPTCGKNISIVALNCPHCGETTLHQTEFTNGLKDLKVKSLAVDRIIDDNITADERETIINYINSSPSMIRAGEICDALMEHYYEEKYRGI
jgi:transcription elongation factor Elf1